MLGEEFEQLRELPYTIWRELVGTSKVKVIQGPDGRTYRVQASPTWSDPPSSDVLVVVSLRSGGRSLGHIERSFISRASEAPTASLRPEDTTAPLETPSMSPIFDHAPTGLPRAPSPPRAEPDHGAHGAHAAHDPLADWPPPDLAVEPAPSHVASQPDTAVHSKDGVSRTDGTVGTVGTDDPSVDITADLDEWASGATDPGGSDPAPTEWPDPLKDWTTDFDDGEPATDAGDKPPMARLKDAFTRSPR